jgi:glycosyltransferase involved in cell wall biosynthesis
MFCSTIIPTIGRPELSRAVHSVLNQTLNQADFEVIVVNDSGRALPGAAWMQSPRVRVLNTAQRERSVARNTGAAIGQGRYLHFLDDDDWLWPDALEHLWQLAQARPAAAWLYGGSQLVDRAGRPLIQLRPRFEGNCFVHVMAGEWLPLQSSLIEAEAFFGAGGFNPHLAGPEDVDLCRRIALRGGVAGTASLVACIGMGAAGSSTDYDRSPRYSRWAREHILNEPGAFARLRASADSAFWQGRISRAYLTSMVWNVQHRQLFTAASRATAGLASLALAGPALFSAAFWQALGRHYDSSTFAAGIQEARQAGELQEIPGERPRRQYRLF